MASILFSPVITSPIDMIHKGKVKTPVVHKITILAYRDHIEWLKHTRLRLQD